MNKNRKHTRTLIAAAAAMMFFAVGTAGAKTDFLAGVHFDAGLPQGEFNDRIDTEAFGASGQIFYAPDTSPVAVGVDLGWSNYGDVSRKEPFGPHIPDVQVKVETMNNFVQGFFVLRGQVPRGPLQVYGDALVGFNYLYTESKVTNNDGMDDVASSTNQDDTAFACGLGGGVMAPVWSCKSESKHVEQVSIDCGARYIWGGQADYLKEGSLHRDGNGVSFEPLHSRTNLTQVRLGVTARF
jgi:hypothetical protein